MPNGKRKYPPLPGFGWEFPWEELSQSWEAWQQQVGIKRAPEDEPGTFEYMMKQWQSAPPKYPAPTATMPWPEEKRKYPSLELPWGDFPYGGPEWLRYETGEIRRREEEPQREALIKQLERYAEGLGMSYELLEKKRAIWGGQTPEELASDIEEYKKRWEWEVGGPAARRATAEQFAARGAETPYPDFMKRIQEAEELGVDTSFILSALSQAPPNRPGQGYLQWLLGVRVTEARKVERERESREFGREQQRVKASYPEEFAEIEGRIRGELTKGYGWGQIYGEGVFKVRSLFPAIEKDPEYQKLKGQYAAVTSPEYARAQMAALQAKIDAEREAEAEWERTRRVEMGARGRWEIPRQY